MPGIDSHRIHGKPVAWTLEALAGTSTSRHGVMGDSGGLGDLALGVQWLTIVRFLTNVRSFTLAASPSNRLLQPQRELRSLIG